MSSNSILVSLNFGKIENWTAPTRRGPNIRPKHFKNTCAMHSFASIFEKKYFMNIEKFILEFICIF